MGAVISFFVPGKPAPAGSKRAFYNARLGRALVVDANANAKPWQAAVASTAAEHRNGAGLIDGPLEVEFIFYVPRPKGHFGTGRNASLLRASAPSHPTGRPDVLKLARGVEDALTGVLWRDDSQIVKELLRKEYGEPAGVHIEVVAA